MRTQEDGESRRRRNGCGPEQRLKSLGIVLPVAPTPLGSYVPAVQSGRLLFLSGMVSVMDGKPRWIGRIGAELTVEDGREAVRETGKQTLIIAGVWTSVSVMFPALARISHQL